MQLSTLVLLVVFVLCCTHNVDRAARRLQMSPGCFAAASVLLLMLSPFDWNPFGGLSILPAGLLLLGFGIWAARTEKAAYTVPVTAFFSGLLGWALIRALMDAWEPGVLIALPAAVTACLLHREQPRTGLLLVLAAPLFYALFSMLSDWYLFGYVHFAVFDALQFDAQLSGALLYAAFLPVRWPSNKNRVPMQKEA